MDKFAELGGGRRSVEPADLATGNAAAGREYFNGEGKCASCHSPTGDLAGIGKRYQGLNLLRRMLYPTGKGPAPSARQPERLSRCRPARPSSRPWPPKTSSRVTVLDPLGARQTYQRSAVKVKIDDPLVRPFRSARKIHGRRHAQRLRLPGDFEVEHPCALQTRIATLLCAAGLPIGAQTVDPKRAAQSARGRVAHLSRRLHRPAAQQADQITPENIARLKQVWRFQASQALKASPIVANG